MPKSSVVVSPGVNPFDVINDPAVDAKKIQEVAALTVKLLDMRYPKPTRILRGVHPKSHGCLKAKFQVKELPPELRVGLFAKPKAYRAWIRYSNASVRVAPDTSVDGKNDSRGMATKVVKAGDETLLADRGRVNQDFLMINQPSFAFANLDDYLRLNKIIFANNDDASAFFGPLIFFKTNNTLPDGVSLEEIGRIGATFKEVQKLQSQITANPLEVQYFSAAPFLFGDDRVMKFSSRPVGELKTQILPENRSDNYLREAVKATIDKGVDIELDFMVQVRSNGPGLEIENATAVWEEAQFPFVPVARITIEAPQEVLDSPKGLERCERAVFSPWHCLPEHQPVGSINRLRKEVYLASKDHRGAEDKDAPGGKARNQGFS